MPRIDTKLEPKELKKFAVLGSAAEPFSEILDSCLDDLLLLSPCDDGDVVFGVTDGRASEKAGSD